MSIYLESTEQPGLYFNGTVLNKRSVTIALFGDLENARIFDDAEEAQEVSELFEVPTEIVEV